MAAEAQAEGPALPPAPPPPLAHGSSPASPEKRGLPTTGNDGGAEEEERRLPEPKRRRACVAALDSVPSSVAEEAQDSPGSGCGGDGDGDGDGDGASFSFHHARGGFVALETTPKFGSFNPPGEAELAALVDLKPAAGHEAEAEGSPEADDEVLPASQRCFSFTTCQLSQLINSTFFSQPASPATTCQPNGLESSQLLGGEADGQVQA